MATALVERETLDSPELDEILGPLPPWPGRQAVLAPAGGDGTGEVVGVGEQPLPSPEPEPEQPARKPAGAPRRRLPRPATGTA
jgi:hypothetical protein